MAIRSPRVNRWLYKYGPNQLSVRPASTYGLGFNIAANNAYPAYTQLASGAALEHDCFLIVVGFFAAHTTATARDQIATIGIDPAGGTNFQDFLPDLLFSCAGTYEVLQGGHWYTFPVFMPAGSTFGIKSQGNQTTARIGRMAMMCYGQPTAPEVIKFGQYVDAIGMVQSQSRGTLVTPGTTAEGAWTSLGTETRPHWWWQFGAGQNDSTMIVMGYHVDLGIGATNTKTIIEDVLVTTPNNVESMNKILGPSVEMGYFETDGTAEVMARAQCSATPNSNFSVAAYAVGG